MVDRGNFMKKRTLAKLAIMALAPLPRTDIGFVRFPDAQNLAGILDNGIGIRK